MRVIHVACGSGVRISTGADFVSVPFFSSAITFRREALSGLITDASRGGPCALDDTSATASRVVDRILLTQEHGLYTGALKDFPAVTVRSDFDNRHNRNFALLCKRAYLFKANMVEQNNAQGHHPKPKRHNARYLDEADRHAIVLALGEGKSVESIARSLHRSKWTIMAVRDQDAHEVARIKQRRIMQWERVAEQALDHLNDKLADKGHSLSPSALAPIAGIATDKISLLRGDSLLTVQHQHEHIHAHITECSYEQLLASLPSRNPQAQSQSEPIDNTPG